MKFLPIIIMTIVSVTTLNVPAVAYGAEIENVYFEDIYEAEGVRMKLRGTGLFMYMVFIKAYVGALYVAEGTAAKDVLSDIPKRLEVEYFHALKGKDFGITTNKMIAKNTDRTTLERIRPQIEYHNSLYEDVGPGDRYSLTYIPGQGTTLALNGEPNGTIQGADAAAAIFSMWLGDFPMNKPFKEQLLGLK
jgi:hypothetical protein